jgi:hypothetical protein
MTFPVTKPPELVVQAKVKKVVMPRETQMFCDSFWAYMLNDYLDDYSDERSPRISQRRSLPIKKLLEEKPSQTKLREKKKQEKQQEVVIEDIPAELNDPLDAELDNLLSDNNQQIDEQREQEAHESPMPQEDLDIIPRNSGLKKSKSRGLEQDDDESLSLDIDKKLSRSTDHVLDAVPRGKASTNVLMHYSPISEDRQAGRSRRLRGERKLALESGEKLRHSSRRTGTKGDSASSLGLKSRGSRDQPLDLTSKYPHGLRSKDITSDDAVGWMIQENKRAEQEYSQRRIDRKEALQRIRAIKSRLHTVDP